MPDAGPDHALAPLGVSELAERTYRVLVGNRHIEAGRVAKLLGVSTEDVLRACQELSVLGLAGQSTSPTRFVPTAPELSVGLLADRREEQLRRARRAAVELSTEYQRVHEGTRGEEIIRIIEGFPAIARQFGQLQQVARSEVLCFSRPPYFDPKFVNEGELELLARGVRCRAVYDRATLEIPDALDGIRTMCAAGEQARVAPRLPMKLYVADRSWALVPLLPESAEPYPAVVQVRASSLLDALIALFDSVWLTAVPLGEAAGGPVLSPVQDQILRMLLAGSTDRGIARTLGIAVRTVQRHVALLQERAGVDTRIQLVWHVAQRGWLDTPAGPAGTAATAAGRANRNHRSAPT